MVANPIQPPFFPSSPLLLNSVRREREREGKGKAAAAVLTPGVWSPITAEAMAVL